MAPVLLNYFLLLLRFRSGVKPESNKGDTLKCGIADTSQVLRVDS
jgi:hypothetical protein